MSTLAQAHERIKANGPKEPFALKFKRLSADSIVSECGEFYVGRVRLGGVESFEVWYKAPGKTALHLRQNLTSGNER